ncbi:MAG: hypothetical protein U0794_02980 [Isosphaeraceae bacterium]
MEPPIDPTRELLVGLLAARTGLIRPADLTPALAAWSSANTRPLGEVLVDRGLIDPAGRATLDDLATRLAGTDGPLSALARLDLDGPTVAELTLLNDPAIDAVLDRVAPATIPAADSGHSIAGDAPAPADAISPRGRLRRSLAFWRVGAVAATMLAVAALVVLTYVNRDRFEVYGLLADSVKEIRRRDDQIDEAHRRGEKRVETVLGGLGSIYDVLGRDNLLRQGEFFPIRSRVLAQARATVDRLEAIWGRAPATDERRALATAYEQLGELQRRLGTLDDALVAHRRARWLRQALVEAGNPTRELRRELARSLLAVGEIEVASTLRKPAQATLGEARALWSNLAMASESGPPELVDHVGLARTDLALARLAALAGDPAEARLALGRSAFSLDTATPKDDPRVLETGIELLAAQAAIETQYGTPHRVLTALDAQQTLRQELNRRRPGLLDNLVALPTLETARGRALDRVGRPREARAALERAIELRQLVDDYPVVAAFRQQLAGTQGLLGAHLEAQGQSGAAREAFARAVDTLSVLAASQPEAAHSARRDYGRSRPRPRREPVGRFREGRALLDRARTRMIRLAGLEPNNPAIAREAAAVEAARRMAPRPQAARRGPRPNRSRARHAQLLRRDHPDVKSSWQDLAASLALKGRWHAARGETRDAAAALLQAITNLEHVGLLDPELFYELAEAEARLAGLGSKPDSGLTADEARLAADQAVKSLAAAADLGLRVPGRVVDNPAFDSIRTHPAYGNLLLDLKVPADPLSTPDPPPGA